MEKQHYTVITGAPGSLLDIPPEHDQVRVFFDEGHAQDDGKGWGVLNPQTTEIEWYFKERYAIAAQGRQDA